MSYCSNQVYVKALLDAKKVDPAIDDFLHRCQESPFSRRLDLWSFLGMYYSACFCPTNNWPLCLLILTKISKLGATIW